MIRAHTFVPLRQRRKHALPMPIRLPCIFEGPIIEECKTCGGRKAENRHVRHCLHEDAEWDTCTRSGRCATCPLHTTLSGRRHLLYHIYPRRGNWQLHAEQLKIRWPLFNGQRIVGIAVDGLTDDPEAVKECLGDADYFVMPNRIGLREVQTWRDLWMRLKHSPGDAIFYSQAKGVTKPANPGVTVIPWASAMLEVLLDYYPAVAAALQTHAIVGMGRKIGGFKQSKTAWHFSGSHFWTREVRDWNTIDPKWFGVESWPGLHYREHESYDLVPSPGNLYRPEQWHDYTKKLQSFRLENRDKCLWNAGGLLQPRSAGD